MMEKPTLHTTRIETPLGTMIAAATGRGVCMLEYADSRHLESESRQLAAAFGVAPAEGKNPHLDTLCRQLDEYFAGERREFDIPLDPVGTPFQKEVWEALRRIPYGRTITYGRQAAIIGRPSATRAVANANGRNKISIVLPCHRVIGADGSLTGYGGGMERKKKLLELEGRQF
jgi:AraC family transcriptional regulator of adaptative response/methylated-DNA-[protein]-cysteine methyltransferase